MGDPRGFLKVKRRETSYRPVWERVKDYREVAVLRSDRDSREQASRCMDCGTPFCHWGCPIGNYIPEWNDLMFNGRWERAFELLDATNNLPEVTGRVCPAICEFACVLGINDDPVTIRENELAIIEYAFKHGLIKPRPPQNQTGKKVAIVGSGPAGLSCAAQLNRFGHRVTVFEKDDKIGGIMRYGIPDFKLDKKILDRRLELWKKEGIVFNTKVEIGSSLALEELRGQFDAVVLAGGARTPRDLKVEGRDLSGIYFAMDYLVQSNRRVAGEEIPPDKLIDAKGKKVVVIGGGDTGADVVGTANRQGASKVVQLEIMPKPPEERSEKYPWPTYPVIFKTSSSHEEGEVERKWSVSTKRFIGRGSKVVGLECVKVDPSLKEIPGTEFEIEADLVILALGFLRPEAFPPTEGLFVAGDMRRGPSLIVWAIYEGRQTANFVHEYLS